MIRRFVKVIVLSSLAAVMGCGDDDEGTTTEGREPSEEARHGLTAEQASEVLVKIGDETITVGEFADQLAEQSPYLRARFTSPERRREFLDNMVRFELLAAEAHRTGHDRDPEVLRTAKQVMIQQMMKTEFEDQIQLSDITDDEIRRYYEEHRAEFEKPEQVRASHILIKNRATAQRVLGELRRAETDVNLFRRTAEQLNEDPETRDRFGDLRFFSRAGQAGPDEPNVPDAIREAAFELEQVGRIHPQLIQTDAGYHIVKLTGRRAALNRTLEDARRPIQNRLWRERREQRVQELIERLRREANVEESFEVLSEIRVEAPPGGSPTGETEQEIPGPTPTPPTPEGGTRRPPAPTNAPAPAPAPTGARAPTKAPAPAP
jgi:peptidyl-prolyl cis-trans isomerase C